MFSGNDNVLLGSLLVLSVSLSEFLLTLIISSSLSD